MSKVKPLNLHQKMTIQLWLGVILAVSGILQLWTSFFVPPMGIIHSSVLAAIGEIFTFSGALIGIDYTYKYKYIKNIRHNDFGEYREPREDTDRGD